MPTHDEQQISPYSPKQLFDLVSAVEKYPEFLPWCTAARILRREDEQTFLAQLQIGFKGFRESYTSRVELCPADELGEDYFINVELVEGPFDYLTNRWKFVPRPEGGTLIDFHLDFRFRSRILEKTIGGLFKKATDKMVKAFMERADELYGN